MQSKNHFSTRFGTRRFGTPNRTFFLRKKAGRGRLPGCVSEKKSKTKALTRKTRMKTENAEKD
jgi:hypothetical protein